MGTGQEGVVGTLRGLGGWAGSGQANWVAQTGRPGKKQGIVRISGQQHSGGRLLHFPMKGPHLESPHKQYTTGEQAGRIRSPHTTIKVRFRSHHRGTVGSLHEWRAAMDGTGSLGKKSKEASRRGCDLHKET